MISYFMRKVDLIIITETYKFNDPLIFTFLMLLGEFVGGSSIYLYQNYFFKRKKTKEQDILELNYFKMTYK